MNNEADLILERIEPLFKRLPHTQYRINIVDNIYDKEYNFFFITLPKGKRQHSIPLHTIKVHDLGYLEEVVNAIQKKIQLTIIYTGFTGQVWPVSQREIQKKRRWDE